MEFDWRDGGGMGEVGGGRGGEGEICELWESFGLERFGGVWILEIGNWNLEKGFEGFGVEELRI